jgi:hypothetical protein
MPSQAVLISEAVAVIPSQAVLISVLAVGGGDCNRVGRCNLFDRYRVVYRVYIVKGDGNISAGGIDHDKLIVPVNIIGAGNGPDCAHNGGAFVIVNRYAGVGAAIVRIPA